MSSRSPSPASMDTCIRRLLNKHELNPIAVCNRIIDTVVDKVTYVLELPNMKLKLGVGIAGTSPEGEFEAANLNFVLIPGADGEVVIQYKHEEDAWHGKSDIHVSYMPVINGHRNSEWSCNGCYSGVMVFPSFEAANSSVVELHSRAHKHVSVYLLVVERVSESEFKMLCRNNLVYVESLASLEKTLGKKGGGPTASTKKGNRAESSSFVRHKRRATPKASSNFIADTTALFNEVLELGNEDEEEEDDDGGSTGQETDG